MKSLRCEAILLRSVDFGESDRIVHLLTPATGRLTAIAKGARRSVKRFPGSLDLCNHLRIHAEQRRRDSMARLEQAVLVDPFLALRTLPSRFGLACYVLELIDRMAPEGGPARDLGRIFDFTLSALRLIASQQPDARMRIWLELRALDALGLRPELRLCVGCGRRPEASQAPAPVGFRVADGGVVCRACALRVEGVIPMHLGTLRALEQALSLPIERLGRLALSPSALREAEHMIDRFQSFHVGLELRSQPVLDRLLARSPKGSAA